MPEDGGHSKTFKNIRILKNTRHTRRVTRNVYNDITPLNKLAEIPNYASYFILIEPQQIYAPYRKASLVQIRTIHGGQRMSEYIMNVEKLLTNWISIQIHLAEGLRILHSRNIVYGDFNFDNIVIDDTNIPLLIDFGDCCTLMKDNSYFNPDSDISPPELDYVNSTLFPNNGHSIMKEIYKKKQILHEIEEVFPSRENVLSELLNFADRYSESTFKNYNTASDMWAFGCEFFKIYMMLLTIPIVSYSEMYQKNHIAQMRILRGLLHPDPRKRLTVDELLIELYMWRMS